MEMELAHLLFHYEEKKDEENMKKIFGKIEENNMVALYQSLTEKYNWNINLQHTKIGAGAFPGLQKLLSSCNFIFLGKKEDIVGKLKNV